MINRPRPNLRRNVFHRPWYMQAVDAAHRVTVLTLVAGTVYYSAFTLRMLYLNYKYRTQYSIEEREEMARQRTGEESPVAAVTAPKESMN
ncbi:hypothetical protein V1525DRAFT_429678 [Lipomyces kononenkoae]|uniref:Uncharacterized protein n=1 Tax=Lipomyces kononenkoae TaxID=34357 RepID=A0ACC3TAU0_LIPKO